jgi:hypothetical protein
VSEDEPGPRDEGLVAFVEAIEATLGAWRGTQHLLSPRDFALARRWYEAGVPLAAVLVAIDRAAADEPSLTSLAPVRRRVESLAALGPRPGSEGASEHASLPELAERLGALRDRLLELPGRVAARPLSELGEIADLVAVASRPNWDYLRARLRRLDELVGECAAEALSSEQTARLASEGRLTAERHRGRVDSRSLEDALARLRRQRARELLRLPRVGLD